MSDLAYLHEVFQAMQGGNKEFMQAARESMYFYTGGYGTGQWDSSDISKLRAEGRPPLQLNIILPKVNLVTGIERQGRTSYRARPVEMNDDNEAKLITSLLYHVDKSQSLQNVFSRVFKDGVITGRGWVDISVEPGEYFDSKIHIRRESWANVLMDPEATSPDSSQWGRLARTKLLSISKAKDMFPDALKDVKNAEDIQETFMGEESLLGMQLGDKYKNVDPNYGFKSMEAYNMDAHRKKIRIIELWEREYEKEFYLVNPQTGRFSQEGFKTKRKANEAIKSIMERPEMEVAPVELSVVAKSVPKTYVTVFAGARVLQEKTPNPYKHNQFPLIPFFYTFEDYGSTVETFGLVENLKDPQREKNKRRSQALDIINRSPKGGGIFTGNKVTAEEMNRASGNGEWIGIPGFKGRISDFMTQWSNQHTALVPTIASFEQRSDFDAKEISGATDPMMGVATSSSESGLAVQTRIRQGMNTLMEQMENLDTCKKNTLEMAVSNMQQYYSVDKIQRIIGAEFEAVEPEEQMQVNQIIGKFLDNFSTMEFDVVLDQGQNTPTMRALMANQVGELVRNGYASLFPLFVELSDMEASDEILEKFEQERQAQVQSQQQQQKPPPQGGEGVMQ